MVWYVAYGSNLSAARFRCYLEGGRAPGARWTNPGARDPTPVRGDRRVSLPHPLMFGGPSHTWRGGPAYLDTQHEGWSVGRAWHISHAQFEDLVAQENGLDPGAVTVDPAMLHTGGVVLDDRYGRLVPLPPIEGVPAVTFSYITRPYERAPDPAYVSLLLAGLTELGLAPAEAAAAIGPAGGA